MALTARIKRIFGDDALDWLDRSYLTDWFAPMSNSRWINPTVLAGLSWHRSGSCQNWLGISLFLSAIFMWPTRSLITRTKRTSQWSVQFVFSFSLCGYRIGGTLNHFVALLVPAAMVLALGLLRLSFVTIHHGILALLAGRGMTRLFTNVLKNRYSCFVFKLKHGHLTCRA
jgi:hypothetical protein